MERYEDIAGVGEAVIILLALLGAVLAGCVKEYLYAPLLARAADLRAIAHKLEGTLFIGRGTSVKISKLGGVVSLEMEERMRSRNSRISVKASRSFLKKTGGMTELKMLS
mgnify:FL=1